MPSIGLPILLITLLCLVCLASSGAWASTVPSGFTLNIQITQDASQWTGTETTLAPSLAVDESGSETTISLTSPKDVLGGSATISSWDSTFDPDPFVTNDFVVVNNSPSTQTYIVTVGAPVTPNAMVGSIVQSNIILTINDDNNSLGAAVSSVSSTPVYEAYINGGSALTFLDDPFSHSCSSPVDCTFNGLSGDAIASQAISPILATSLGLTITFNLSPGDSAAVHSRFEVVPEPGTAMLFGLGLMAMTARGRRR